VNEIVESESFQRWFGHSKVCSAAGNALIAVRNASSGARWFPNYGSRVFVQIGDWYGTHAFTSEEDLGAGELPAHSWSLCVFLCIQKPKEFSDLEELSAVAEGKWGSTPISRMRKLRLDLKKQGHDGIIVRNGSPSENLDLWAAFDRKQIRSATDFIAHA
jgi:hypothetical protein